VKGQVKDNEVVMVGDSYMSGAPYGLVGQDVVANSMKNWTRLYYFPGSAMAYGSGSLNIPYEFDTQAEGASSDIKVVIMDGGGNDVLIDNRQCLTSFDSTCMATVDMAVATADKLLMDMASKGVQHIVYFYYPHLTTAGGGLLPTPATDVNTVDDYALAKQEKFCCGATFTSSTTNFSCRGNGPGTDCVIIDTIPSFMGHLNTDPMSYFLSDDVHPNAMGSQVIANLVTQAMQQYCIAQ
jgi:hypothetical protein